MRRGVRNNIEGNGGLVGDRGDLAEVELFLRDDLVVILVAGGAEILVAVLVPQMKARSGLRSSGRYDDLHTDDFRWLSGSGGVSVRSDVVGLRCLHWMSPQ